MHFVFAFLISSPLLLLHKRPDWVARLLEKPPKIKTQAHSGEEWKKIKGGMEEGRRRDEGETEEAADLLTKKLKTYS